MQQKSEKFSPPFLCQFRHIWRLARCRCVRGLAHRLNQSHAVYTGGQWMSLSARGTTCLVALVHVLINVLSIGKHRFTRPCHSTPVQHCSQACYSTDFVLFQAKEPRTVLKLLIIPMTKTNSRARVVVDNHKVHRWTKHLSVCVRRLYHADCCH
jgi:hypothetical protein